MSGSVWQIVKVEVGFGDGPFEETPTWTDISAYVRLVDQITWSRGANPETGEPEPGRLGFVVNNDSGDFTPGTVGTFGEVRNRLLVRISVLGLDTPAAGSPLLLDSPVMLNAGLALNAEDYESLVLWTGTVETWAQQWTGGVRAAVSVTGVDRWARLQRRRLPVDAITGHILASQGTGLLQLWPLTEDKVSNTYGSLFSALPDGATLEYGPVLTGTWPLKDQSFTTGPLGTRVLASTSEPKYYAWSTMPPATPVTAGFTAAWWVSVTEGLAAIRMEFGGPAAPWFQWVLLADADTGEVDTVLTEQQPGTFPVTTTTTTPAGLIPDDGTWHFVAATCDDTTTRLYVDGVQVATAAQTLPDLPLRRVEISQSIVGATSHLAVWARPLSAADLLGIYEGGTGVAETADARAQRIADLDGGWPVEVAGTPVVVMSKQDLTDLSPADAILQCAQADGGKVWINRDGWPVIEARNHRHTRTPVTSIPATALDRDITFTLDDQSLINRVTATRMVGGEQAGQVIRENEASITAYDRQETSVDLYVRDTVDLLDIAQGLANRNATPSPRSASVTVDLYTAAASVDVPAILALNPGDLIRITDLPDTAAASSIDLWVDGIAGKISDKEFRVTLTVSPVTTSTMYTDADHTTDDGYRVGF